MKDKHGHSIQVGDRIVQIRTGDVLTVREIDGLWPKTLMQLCRCDNAATQEDSDAGKATHSAWLTSKEIIV